MKFEDKHPFDKPAATVIKMFSDRAYFERKYKDLGGWDIEVLEHEKSAKKFRIKVRYTIKASGQIPAFAQKFLGDSSTVTQQDAWDLEKMTGRLDVEVKGLPAKVSADMTLKSDGKGAANHLIWNVSCGIPLIGGKLESVIADDIRAKSGADIAVSRKLLAGY